MAGGSYPPIYTPTLPPLPQGDLSNVPPLLIEWLRQSYNLPITNGIYTPVATNILNITSSGPDSCCWSKLGKFITVSGAIRVDPTLSDDWKISITIPINTTDGILTTVGGVGGYPAGPTGPMSILADPSLTNEVLLRGNNNSSLAIYYFIFSYHIDN